MGNIFVVAACTAGKGRQGRFNRGYNILPHKNYPLYGTYDSILEKPIAI